MLQIIFGDDEHTAADGPYTRVMKTRKWLYLSSAALTLINYGFYKQVEADKIVKIVSLSQSFLAGFLTIGLAYLLVQYIALCGQLVSVYDIILSERFSFRRADDLANATTKVKDAQISHENAVQDLLKRTSDNFREEMERIALEEKSANSDLAEAIRDRNRARSEGVNAAEEEHLKQEISRLSVRRNKARAEIERINDVGVPTPDIDKDPTIIAHKQAVEDAVDSLNMIRSQVPAERPAYRNYEKLIDIFRCTPPIAIASYALLDHFW